MTRSTERESEGVLLPAGTEFLFQPSCGAGGYTAREQGTMLQAHMNEYMGEVNGIVDREGMRPL